MVDKFNFRLKFFNASIADNNVPRVPCGRTVGPRGDCCLLSTRAAARAASGR